MDDDLISRQGLIDFLAKIYAMKGYGWEEVHFSMNDMEMNIIMQPSVQPQIIYCAECTHWKHSAARKSYCEVFDWMSKAEDFCSFAERRKEGEQDG